MNAITGLAAFGFAAQTTGEVLARQGQDLVILANGAEAPARRALSCLVEPEPGDLVLLAAAQDRRYVLAVLERPGDAALRVALPDGASIDAEGGRLRIGAATLVLEADNAQLAAGRLGVAAGGTEVRLGRVRMVAEAVEALAERIIGRFRRSYRFVEEGEHLRARDIDHRASGHLHLRGDTTAVQANALVKVQSGQIHLG
jgi:hypothetical protein